MADPQNKQQRLQAHLTRVLQEMQQAQQGTKSRQDLIRQIENLDAAKPRRLLLYIANPGNPASAVNAGDTVPLGDALAAMGKVENLDLVVHTFGGSGETAEKIVEMCRNHCQGEFRVVVPNMAKSAGTLIALGADRIVMGYCSELGPIDPQIPIVVGNTPQHVSAWTFIHTRDVLVEEVNDASAKKQNASAYLQQLAAVDPVFVTHCEQLMTFAKQVGSKWIVCRLKGKGVNAKQAGRQAATVVKFLSNVEAHITHGRLISVAELKKHCEPALSVVELQESEPHWQLLWELYVRSEVFLKMAHQGKPAAKLIETGDVSIILN